MSKPSKTAEKIADQNAARKALYAAMAAEMRAAVEADLPLAAVEAIQASYSAKLSECL